MYMYIHVCLYILKYVYIHIMYACMYECMQVCMHVLMYSCIYVFKCVHVCMFMCVCTNVWYVFIYVIITEPKAYTRNDTTRARVATSRENTCAKTSIQTAFNNKSIWDKSPTSHYDICCYCIAYGSRVIHAYTQ